MSEPILRLEGLSKYYTSSQTVVMGLSELSLSFSRGEFVAVTGQSGSGKSTLAHVLGGILPYESGELFLRGSPTSHFDGTDWERYRRDNISFISQNYGILPGCSVMENVISALRLSGMGKAESRRRATDILHEVELWGERSRRASRLSSGQKQRLAIARALAKPAAILIADEPTGNLDPENSARVISLLHRASRERLVILITHEFSEAEAYATRHIALQDGRVVIDAALRAPHSPEAEKQHSQPAKTPGLGAYVARLQLGGRRAWSALVLAFFALSAFAVFAFMGSFIISLDDTSTRVYDPSAFQNGSKQRLVVMRSDYEPLTDSDYETILSAEHVRSLEKWGFLSDINYAWREGVDYEYSYAVRSEGNEHDRVKFISSSVKMRSGAPFLQSLPLLADGADFISAGREPENVYEVAARGDASLIGSKVSVYITDNKNWSSSVKIPLEVEIVGVTDYGSGLYFHDDLGRAFDDYYTRQNAESLMLYAFDLDDDMVRLSQDLYTRFVRHEKYSFDLYDFTRPIITDKGDESWETFEVDLICQENGNAAPGLEPTHGSYLSGYILLSRNNFNRCVTAGSCQQVSVTISDYAYTDRVLEQLRDLGYVALSPFREGSTKVNAALAQEREQTLSVCAAALLVVLLLQIIVLRALFSAQNETYSLLAHIGLVCPTAKRSVWWQVLLFTLSGQLLALAGLFACRQAGIERIVSLWRYLPPAYMLLLSAVHMAAACAGAYWVSRAMARQVFPTALTRRDLELEEEAEA